MSKIVVMDSGFGGLTVLSELRKLMPDEEYIFYGDSANAPYGEKSHDELLKLTTDICRDLSSEYDVKCFVIACNTTSSEVWDELTQRFDKYDFIGIEPALKWAVEENPGKNILVLATTATTKGKRLKKRYEEFKGKANITLLAAPGIVPFVEGDKKDAAAFQQYLKELLKDYIGKTDCVVLGCTHFPFVKDEIRQVLGNKIKFYDAAVQVAELVKSVAVGKMPADVLNDGNAAPYMGVPVHIYIDTAKATHNEQNPRHLQDDPEALKAGASVGDIIFLNSDPSKVEAEAELLDEYSSMHKADNL